MKKKTKKKLFWLKISMPILIILFSLFLFEIIAPAPNSSDKSIIDRNDIIFDERIPIYVHSQKKIQQNMDKISNEEINIVVIGDSFTYGLGVKRNETYAHFLEGLLNTKNKGNKFRVINAGINGYNLQQVNKLYKTVIQYDPDIIIFGLMTNDFDQYKIRKTKDNYIITYYNAEIPDLLNIPFNEFLTRFKIGKYINLQIFNKKIKRGDADIDYIIENKDKSEDMLFEMYNSAVQKEIQFYVFLLPDLHGDKCRTPIFYNQVTVLKEDFVYSDFSQDLNELISNRCEDLAIHNFPEPGVDGHPNVEGHRLFAQLLYNFLLDEKVI